jgi:hypothetical protein
LLALVAPFFLNIAFQPGKGETAARLALKPFDRLALGTGGKTESPDALRQGGIA